MNSGRFITVEGIEGAGKSTCLALIARTIEAAGIPLLTTREPGGTGLGEELRDLLLGHRDAGMSMDAELLLMFAARAEHLQTRIEPALSTGTWVLCDRFTDATYAYQGGGRGIEIERIAQLETWVQRDRRPDLTLLLDLPVELGLKRAGKRSQLDRFEQESKRFFERVRDSYLQLAQRSPKRIRLIDASRPLPEVEAQILEVLAAFLDEATDGGE